jgi:hypothetical protein
LDLEVRCRLIGKRSHTYACMLPTCTYHRLFFMYSSRANSQDKYQMVLEEYIVLIMQICDKFEFATVMDLRSVFQKKVTEAINAGEQAKDLDKYVGLDWQGSSEFNDGQMGGIMTFDGDHLNKRGTQTFVSLLVEQADKWSDLWSAVPGERGKYSGIFPEVQFTSIKIDNHFIIQILTLL